jgi:hypothetical protein
VSADGDVPASVVFFKLGEEIKKKIRPGFDASIDVIWFGF